MTKQNLILIPGLVCDDQVWQHQAEFLNDIAEIIIPPVVKSSTMFGLAEEVLAISPETFAVAGFSMGGYVAYRQAGVIDELLVDHRHVAFANRNAGDIFAVHEDTPAGGLL